MVTTKSQKTSPSKKEDVVNKEIEDERRQKIQAIKQFTAIIITIVLCGCAYVLLILFPTEGEEQIDAEIRFTTEYIDDAEMELGTSEIEQLGVTGKKVEVWKVKRSGLLAMTETSRSLEWSEVTEPVNQIIRQGTRKWQYMICSDGSYRYYTDEQFAEPSTGFTHASEDSCAKNNHGAMVELADQPPAKKNTTNNTNGSQSLYRPYTYSPSYTPSYSQSAPPEPTATYQSPELNQWTPSGSTDTTVNPGQDKWCGFVGNEYICK